MTQTDMYENQSVLLNGYCQSCGMPFRFGTENQFGTRDDRSLSGEYCYLCLRDGVWVDDLTLEQMIDMWVEHTDMYNEISGTRYSPDALRAVLMKRLPTLKRWHGEVQVVRFHRQAVWNVKKYVTSHINEDLKVERLCLVANMSLSHLRRVFKLIAGESIGVYIQRVRLERIAYSLLATDLPVKDIMLSSSFQTKHSLAKAFTQYFGLPPTEYRKKHAGAIIRPDDRMPTDESAVTEPYHIKKLNACRIVCMEMDNAYRTLAEYRLLWKRFIHELTLAGVDTGEYDAEISMDELEELAETAGAVTVCRIIQKRPAIESATILGEGKIEELSAAAKDLDAQLIIFDMELSSSQIRNIEDITSVRVIDRTMLILDIFAGNVNKCIVVINIDMTD